jgi:hypothetical protein
MTRHWDLTTKEKLTTMRNSLELRGIPPIKRTVEENLDPGVQSVRDLTGKLSCSIAVSDQKPGNHTFVVDSEYSPVCLDNRYKIMRAGERRYIYSQVKDSRNIVL